MRSVLRALSVAGIVTSLPACIAIDAEESSLQAGEAVTRTYDTGGISRVRFLARGELRLTRGDAPALVIRGRDGYIERVTVDVRGDLLVVTDAAIAVEYDLTVFSWNSRDRRRTVVYELEIEDLESLEVGAHGRVDAAPMAVRELRIRLDDHSDARFASIAARRCEVRTGDHVDLRIEAVQAEDIGIEAGSHTNARIDDLVADELSADVHNHADLRLAGQVGLQHVDVAGHADYVSGDLVSDVAHVLVERHGYAAVNVRAELYARRQRHGHLDYTGSPRIRSPRADD